MAYGDYTIMGCGLNLVSVGNTNNVQDLRVGKRVYCRRSDLGYPILTQDDPEFCAIVAHAPACGVVSCWIHSYDYDPENFDN